MAGRSIDDYETKLQDGALDAKSKALLLTELRDNVDSFCQGSNYAAFLSKLVPLFLHILSGPPVFTSTSPEQKVRQCILDIIHRLPLASADHSVAEPEKIVDACLGLVKVENEENAVLCLKIVMDFCRYYAKNPAVAEKAQPFLDLILDIFDGIEQTVNDTFDSISPTPAAAPPGTPTATGTPGSPVASSNPSVGSIEAVSEQQQSRQLAQGMRSFKVVAECPIIVVSIFQAYRSLSTKNVSRFTPKIRQTLLLQAAPQKRAHEEAEANGEIFTGVAREIKAKGQAPAFCDLITAQVKTMSFLAYLLRVYQNSLTDFLPTLPDLTVRLLRDVPRSQTATRKELLVAIRHIINFNIRNVFLDVILPLLDAKTLVGDSLTADVTLRPLAYTMLADLVHHVRERLSPAQISKVVSVYLGHLAGDDSVDLPGTSYQTMSAKLLLNMAECMSKIEDKKDARYLMMLVLNGIADKFAALNRACPNATKLSRQQAESGHSIDAVAENYLADHESKPDWDETDIFSAVPIKPVSPRDRAMDPVSENKFLFKNLLHGLKTFFFQLRNSNPPTVKDAMDPNNVPKNWNDLSYGFTAEEVEVLIKLFREGVRCFQYYAPQDGSADTTTAESASSQSLNSLTASSKDEKDLLETFATIFHHLDPATFHEIFTSQSPVADRNGDGEIRSESGIEFLYQQCFTHPALLHIPQFLLASEATSPAFCGMLLRFLMSKLHEVGERDITKTSILLRLFKLSFMAVTLFSQYNEHVLLPHVSDLITRSIELSVTADEPINYFLLLRSLFRSIGGGRFEHLYKNILPLLEMLLEVLNTHLAAAEEGGTRDLFVELSLTVPARLSHLLPHLGYLMRPLTVALRSGERTPASEHHGSITAGTSDLRSGSAGSSELTAQGLRTLELCVDNLTADYLDPIMQPWMEDIMGSLWRMLKPGSLTTHSALGVGLPTVVTGHAVAHTAVRILGKLGGRNRRFLTSPPALDWRPYADDEASVDVKLLGVLSNGGERAMPARFGVDTAVERLWEPVPKAEEARKTDEHYKRQALRLVTNHVKLLIGFDNLPDDLARLVRLQADDLAERRFDFGPDLFGVSERSKCTAKRDAQQATLLKLLRALMWTAGTLEDLKQEASAFLQGIYRHFMLVELGVALAKEKHADRPFDVRSGEGPVFLETSILAQAICDSLASDSKSVRTVAEQAMQSCLKMAAVIFGGGEHKAECLPFFNKLAEVCVHACYEEEWFMKQAGSSGIALLTDANKMRFGDRWVVDKLLDFVRALLYVIKDMPQDLPAGIRLRAHDTIVVLVVRFGRSEMAQKESLANKEDKLHQLASRLTSELSHVNRHVREAAQLGLKALSTELKKPIHEIIQPVKDDLIKPIFNKPLRALPFAAQIGYMEAINFLLDIEHDILTFNEELNRLLSETLALVDADDEHLAAKPSEFRNMQNIVRLRVAGLKLLTTAIRFPGFASGQPTPSQQNKPPEQAQVQTQQQASSQHRARVISIFFKSLYSPKKEVASAANAGLKIVLAATQKLPKDLLQNGLRPILMNVQDPRKLSVEGLEGLRTLLQLLTNYFKVEIGTRLLDHMKHIADPLTLQKISFALVDEQRPMKVVTAIFWVFHLLPSAALQFLNELVERVVTLEASLRRTRSSPFREPLLKYLNHYADEAWVYFKDALKDRRKGRFFAQMLADTSSGPLRDAILKDLDAFVAAFTGDDIDADGRAVARISAIHIADSICLYPDAGAQLINHEATRRALLEAGIELQMQCSRDALPSELRLAAVQSNEQIMRIMVVYLRNHRDDLTALFGLFESCTMGQLHATSALYSYLYQYIITSEDVEFQRSVIIRCIDTYTARTTESGLPMPQRLKWFVFHNILNPILANDVMRNWDGLFDPNAKGTPLLNKDLTEAIHNRLWKPQSVADLSDDGTQGVDHSRMELLQTSALLIKYHSNMLSDTRKDLIKFGWNYIRLEDHVNKYAAYCLIAYFIAHYDTPPKIAMQVYNTLLRAHQAEGKNLVLQSLEILEPVLKKRLGGGADNKQSLWSRIPRRVLGEELGNVQQITGIFQFLVRHPDLFYEARETFAQILIPSITKVAQLPSSSSESRRLAFNIFSLIWQWEERTYRELGSLDGASTADKDPVAKGSKKASVAPANVRFILIKYMVQFIATLPERFPAGRPKEEMPASSLMHVQHNTTETVVKTTDLLYKFLSAPYWDDVNIDEMVPKVTEQILCSDHKPDDKLEHWITRVVNTIQIVKVFVSSRPSEWVVARLPQLQKLLAKSLKSESIDIQDALHNTRLAENVQPRLPGLLERILSTIPLKQADDELPDADNPTEEFVNFISNLAGDALNNGNHLAGINILWTMAQRKPDDIDVHIPALLKTLQQKLAKDHLAIQFNSQIALAQAQGVQPPLPNAPESELNADLIMKIIDMLSARMSILGESRRPYLSVLASLVERSNNTTLCKKILNQVEEWVFNSSETVPTLKEKTAVLQKMLVFEHKQDLSLYVDFMNLVIRIYEDPKIFRSELAVRMEDAFLIGLRSPDIEMRARFTAIYDKALSRSMSNRFFKLICEQQWDVLGDSFWLSQVIQLMFGTVDHNSVMHLHSEDYRCLPVSRAFGTYSGDGRAADVMLDESLEALIAAQRRFIQDVGSVKARDILVPLSELQHTDWQLAHDVWVAWFPMWWSGLSKDDREDIEQGLVVLLTKDFHQRQVDRRPNCVSTLLEGIARAKPVCKFPPHVMKYLAKTYDAWYVAATYMEDMALKPAVDTVNARESTLDALVEIYATLEETDLFYGTWRRRAQFVETNAALSYEQNGLWDKAQNMYEQAQIKARTGSLPFSQAEYMLWEDQWVLCAQKLQSWDILADFAKHENINDLYLESMWRVYDYWKEQDNRDQLESIIKAVSDAPTPRRLFFQAFVALLKVYHKQENGTEFTRVCDENIQLSIRSWHKLPRIITNAHIGLLQNFQQLVELHDAFVICQSLAQTNASNLDMKSQELKVLLSTWRDRLPNIWDDINSWQELVTWRQHIFTLINTTYLGLIQPQTNNAAGNSYAYRGYHEMAWIINRFAHVARKHQMPDVCITQLSRIYTLPNIEIQEAFLKLREQAKCHYQNRSELTSGLDVINNTNLSYFGQQQKAEFYTLKGMFLSKLNQKEEAHDAFGTALFFDIKLPKAWAEWGRYSDFLFKMNPTQLELAANAISCYLEAAGQYKSAKSRKLLSRILWLLSLDDAQGTLAEAYNKYQGEQPWWYWVTFIPQLLNNLSRTEGEANIAHQILTSLAKTYPQALHFQLRTSHEDMLVIRRGQEQKAQREREAREARQRGDNVKQESPSATRPESASGNSRPNTSGGDTQMVNGTSDETTKKEPGEESKTNEPPKPKKPWQHTEALVTTLRTAFPLLYASMEAMVENIQKYLKCPPDEDAYRLIVALLNDALGYIGRSPQTYGMDSKLPPQTESNISRFAENILPPHIRTSFEADFVKKKPTMFEYLRKLRMWRDKLAERLDRRPATFHLAETTHLSGFRFVWFDEVEVPGQYLQHRDKNQDFVRIERFMPVVDLVRSVNACHRRLKIRGHDGTIHPFAIQHPAPRHSRREERILQLFRIFNSTLSKKKESRRRNLQFHLPVMVPLSPTIRIIQDDASYNSLQGIFEDYCRRNDLDKDDPIIYTMEKLRGISPQKSDQYVNVRTEAMYHVQERYVPKDVVRQYLAATHQSFDSFWLFRKQFSYQLAALTYITFTMHMTMRYPNKMNISRQTGNIWGSELLPFMPSQRPFFQNPEPVPFRLTPNLQVVMGPIHTEGIFVCALMAIARCLTSDASVQPAAPPSTQPNASTSSSSATNNPAAAAGAEVDKVTSTDLEHHLSIFIRDEMTFWYTTSHRQNIKEGELRENVQRNADAIVNKAVVLAREPVAGNLPASQSVLDLVARATNPEKLCQTDLLWMPWL